MPLRFVCSGWGPRLALAAAVILIQTAWGAGMTVVTIPCNQPSPVPAGSPVPYINAFRSCNAVMNGQPAMPATATRPFPIPSVQSLPQMVFNKIQQQSDCAYQGFDLDVSNPALISQNSCKGKPFGHPCSLVPHPFNNWTAEATADYKGTACSNTPIGINVTHGHCAMPTLAASPIPAPEQSLTAILEAPPYNLTPDALDAMSPSDLNTLYAKVNTQYPTLVQGTTSGGISNCVQFTFNQTQGEEERTWNRGAWLQALAYETKQVLNEVSCNGAIQINSDPTQDGCAAFALVVQGQIQQATAVQQKYMLNGAAAAPDIDNCAADWTPPTNSGGVSTMDPGHLRQVSQHLCAARSSLEAEYAQLLTCEIIQKAQTSYAQNLGLTEAARQVTLANIMNDQSPTDPWAMHPQCDYCRTGSNSYHDATVCMQACYQKNLPADLTLFYNHFWNLNTPVNCSVPGKTPYSFPNQPSSPSSNASDVLGFAFLAGSLRRKRKSKDSQRRKALRVSCFLVAAGILGACSQAKSLPSVPTPSTSNVACPGGDPSCCPPAGAPSSWTAPSTCLSDSPGTGGVSGANAAGVGETGVSQGELAAATGFTSGGAGSGGGYSAESGAAAAPGSAAAAGSGGTGASAMASLPSLNSGSGSGSNGGSGSGSSGSGLDGSGNTTTAAASPGPAASSGPDAVKAMEASYSGGGAGPGAGSKGGSGFLYGNGLVGGGAGAGGDVGFGKTGGPAASGDPDPADYFQRIEYGADIFREVTKVYEKTSTNWAASNANVPASSGMSDAGSATAKQQPPPQK